LLRKQDTGTTLTDAERHEAEGLVDLADLLSLLRLRSERMSSIGFQPVLFKRTSAAFPAAQKLNLKPPIDRVPSQSHGIRTASPCSFSLQCQSAEQGIGYSLGNLI
jgi:hypothetical protein